MKQNATNKMKIAITGTTGFIGGELVSYFTAMGHDVIRLQRCSVYRSDERFCDLRSTDSVPNLAGIDALIHTAVLRYDQRRLPDSSDFNIRAVLALEKACNASGTRLVFLTTMSAHADATSHCGRHKYELEQQLDLSKDLILRLGIVLGRKGILGSIQTAISRHHITPLINGGVQPIQPVAVTDVCRIIEKAIRDKRVGIYNVGSEKIYTIRDLYLSVAGRLGKKPMLVSVPYFAASATLGVMDALHVPLRTSQENLLDLKELRSFDTKSDLEKLGATIMDMNEMLNKLLYK